MKKHEVNIIIGRINSYQDAIYSVSDNIERIDKKKEGATLEREEELNRLCAEWERRAEEYEAAKHELINILILFEIPIATRFRNDGIWKKEWYICK